METMLQKVYAELKYLKKVKNQTDFGDKLGYNKGYTSTLLKSVNLPNLVRKKLKEVFNISGEWLDGSEGATMFLRNKNETKNRLTNEKDGGNAVNLLSSNKTEDDMTVERLMGIMEQTNANTEKLATAIDKFATALVTSEATNSSLANTIHILVSEGRGNQSFQKAG